MTQGDIILVPFPFTDLSSVKTRPALVVSKNNRGDDVIIVAVTSQKGAGVTLDNDDLSMGKLPIKSYVRLNKVVTLDKKLAKKVVAKVGNPLMCKILGKFVKQF